MEHCTGNERLSNTEVVSSLPFHIIDTPELEVRRTLPEDAEALFSMLKRNPDIPAHVAWAKDVNSESDVIPHIQRLSNETMEGRYTILTEGHLAGNVWVFPGIQDGEFGAGYCLDSTARGKRLIEKTVEALIGELRVRDAKQIYFQIVLGNTRSISVPQKLGCKPAEKIMGKDFPVEQQRWRLSLL